MSALYVIVSHGSCVINGLGQVKVYSDKAQAETHLDNMATNGQRVDGYQVREVHLVGSGE